MAPLKVMADCFLTGQWLPASLCLRFSGLWTVLGLCVCVCTHEERQTVLKCQGINISGATLFQ